MGARDDGAGDGGGGGCFQPLSESPMEEFSNVNDQQCRNYGKIKLLTSIGLSEIPELFIGPKWANCKNSGDWLDLQLKIN